MLIHSLKKREKMRFSSSETFLSLLFPFGLSLTDCSPQRFHGRNLVSATRQVANIEFQASPEFGGLFCFRVQAYHNRVAMDKWLF